MKSFLARSKKRSAETVQTRVKAASQLHEVASDQFIKICHEELVQMMKGETARLRVR